MTSRLEDIGFYTLCDERARNSSATSPMWRCELVLTDKCNFRCPYCRGLGSDRQGDIDWKDAVETLSLWSSDGLKHVRFSGGEPTLHPHLPELVAFARECGVQRIALSTNGSAERDVYERLLARGVDDFSVSLDACCASFADVMAGCKCGFDHVCDNIRFLAARAYTTVGVVVNEQNVDEVQRIVEFADGLGVADIRVIPAAQHSRTLATVKLSGALLDRHPILRYRIRNAGQGRPIRGLGPEDPRRCYLVYDDSAVAQGLHFPCIIYMRENGAPVGKIGPYMRAERMFWSRTQDIHKDPICRENCLDVCVDYNRRVEKLGTFVFTDLVPSSPHIAVVTRIGGPRRR